MNRGTSNSSELTIGVTGSCAAYHGPSSNNSPRRQAQPPSERKASLSPGRFFEASIRNKRSADREASPGSAPNKRVATDERGRADRESDSASRAGFRAEQHSLPFGANRTPVAVVASGPVVAGARS
jgi:hypothetical protein